jgi:hypothetical protein
MSVCEQVEIFCRKFSKQKFRRYVETFLFVYPALQSKEKIKLLELGVKHPSEFVEIIQNFFEVECHTYAEDLRYEFKKSAVRGPYDLILCTELLEQTNDRYDSCRNSFTYHGMLVLLKECSKLMCSDSVLLITTPNICSWTPIYNILNYIHPYYYKSHVRELSHADMVDLFGKIGLKIREFQDKDIWSLPEDQLDKITKLIDILTDAGFSTEKRGDHLMYLIGI